MTASELLSGAVAAAEAGGRVLAGWFRRADLEVRRKGVNDFVTRADSESEAAVVAELRRRFPGCAILAEEGGSLSAGAEAPADGRVWVVDPLDGTTNFLQGLPVYCVSIACVEHEEPIAAAMLDPEGGNLFTATRGGGAEWNGRRLQVSPRPGLAEAFLATGFPFKAHGVLDAYLATFREVFLVAKAIRRCGSAALDLAYTAAGVYDGFFEFHLAPWDLAAGILLVREAGGVATDLDGGSAVLESGSVVAGGVGVQRELLAAVRRHALPELAPRRETLG